MLRGTVKIWLLNNVVHPSFIGRFFDTYDRPCKTNMKLFTKDDNNMENIAERVFTKMGTEVGIRLEKKMLNPLENLPSAS